MEKDNPSIFKFKNIIKPVQIVWNLSKEIIFELVFTFLAVFIVQFKVHEFFKDLQNAKEQEKSLKQYITTKLYLLDDTTIVSYLFQAFNLISLTLALVIIELIIYCYQLMKQVVKLGQDDEYDYENQLKKSHTVITPKKREKLIQFVIEKNMTIYRAAKRLKVCHPTAKYIVKAYRQAHNLPPPVKRSSIRKNVPFQNTKVQCSPEITQKNQRENLSIQQINIQANQAFYIVDQSTYTSHLWSLYHNFAQFTYN